MVEMKIFRLSIAVSCFAIICSTTLAAFSESDTTIPYSVHPINDTAFAVTGMINKITENALVALEIKNNANNSPIFVAQTTPVAGGNFTFIVPKTGPLWQNVTSYSIIVSYLNSSVVQNRSLVVSDVPHGVFLDVIKVPNPLQSPLQQFRSGVSMSHVVCKQGLQLILKAEDETPACAKPSTVFQLVKRGWGSLENLLTEVMNIDNSKFSANYTITNAKILDIKSDPQSLSVIVDMKTNNDGNVVITLPPELLCNTSDLHNVSLYVLNDGQENEYQEIKTTHGEVTLLIPFVNGTKQIEIIGAHY